MARHARGFGTRSLTLALTLAGCGAPGPATTPPVERAPAPCPSCPRQQEPAPCPEPTDPAPEPAPASGVASSSAAFLDEWYAKRRANVPGHEPRFLHLIFEEWFPEGHVRVSVRGDGRYAVELDGYSGWNRWLDDRARARVTRAGGFFHGAGAKLSIGGYFDADGLGAPRVADTAPRDAPYPSCAAFGRAFHAQLTVVAEFSKPAVFQASWDDPSCPGYPRAIARDAWALVERAVGAKLAIPARAAASREDARARG
ncbi:MAG: hypothetical protein H6713_37225 [Myxococcales bacterium]|nr:hypothetical protein [Myxococcales bacterium]MCB9755607.1 hypothetical protein [Myxococcales bacterium]